MAAFERLSALASRLRRDPLARSSALAVFFRVSSAFVSLLTGIVIARTLGAEGKGALAYLTTAVNFVARLTSFGLEAAFTRLHRVKGERADVTAGAVMISAIALGLASGLVVNAALTGVPELSAAVPPALTRLTFWLMPAAMVMFVLGPILYSLGAEVAFGGIDLGMRVGMLAVTLAVAGTDYNTLVTVGALQQLVLVVAAVVGYWWVRRRVGGRLPWSRTTVAALFTDAPAIYGYNTLRYALGYGSTLLAAQWLGVADAGVFSVALMLGESVTLLSTSINLAFYPAVSTADRPAAYAKRVAGLVMLLCLVTGCGLLAVSDWLLSRVYGSAFARVTPVFMAMLPGVVLLGGEQVVSSLFVAAGHARAALVVTAVGLVLLPLLAWPLTARAGIEGLAIATSAAQAAAAGLCFVLFRRHAGRWHSRLS